MQNREQVAAERRLMFQLQCRANEFQNQQGVIAYRQLIVDDFRRAFFKNRPAYGFTSYTFANSLATPRYALAEVAAYEAYCRTDILVRPGFQWADHQTAAHPVQPPDMGRTDILVRPGFQWADHQTAAHPV